MSHLTSSISINLTNVQKRKLQMMAEANQRSMAWVVRQTLEDLISDEGLMMQEPFEDFNLDVIHHEEEVWLTAEQIGTALDYANGKAAPVSRGESGANQQNSYATGIASDGFVSLFINPRTGCAIG